MSIKNIFDRRGKSLMTTVTFTVMVFALALFVNFSWFSMTHRVDNEKSHYMLNDIAKSQSRAIERRLLRSLDAAYLLQLEVEHNNGEFPHFNEFAQHIIDKLGGISNLQLAPMGVVTTIHPIAGNEGAIGHDILKSDMRRAEALLAVTERELTLAGPFDLVQGGTAVVGRNPVFLNDKFWGFASVLIYLDDLLEATELGELEQHGYRFELIKDDPRINSLRTFLTSSKPITDKFIQTQIKVPNGRWLLKISADPKTITSFQIFEILFSLFFSTILAMFFFYFYRAPENLRINLKLKTQSLQHRSAVLEQMTRGESLTNILQLALDNLQMRNRAKLFIALQQDDGGKFSILSSKNVPTELNQSLENLMTQHYRQIWPALNKPALLDINKIDQSDGHFSDFYQCLVRANVKGCWSTPIFANKQQQAALLVLSNNINKPAQEFTDELEQETLLIGLAIEQSGSADKLKKMQLAVENSPNGVLVLNSLAEIEFSNAKFSEISGYIEDELIGVTIDILNLQNNDQQQYQDLLGAIKLGVEWRGEIESQHKNGQRYLAHNYLSPIANDQSAPTHFVLMQEDVTEFRRISAQMAYDSSHDTLTGLLNRSELETQVNLLVNNADSEKHQHAFCFLDLDQFKSVNDSFGHRAGDELLKKISELILKRINHGDLLARLGGDEFVIVMQNTPTELACKRMQELIYSISQYRFDWQGKIVSIGASVGVVEIKDKSQDFIQLLKYSGVACYIAKDNGRNRVLIYNEQEQQVTLQQSYIQWASVVRDALENDKFLLYVQPIIPLAVDTKRLIGFEVLIRLQGDDGKIISPINFLPAAERYNLATSVDRWVIATTLDWFEHNVNLLDSIGFISVNLSGASVGDEALLKFIIAQFKQRKIDPSKFKIEITETAAISDLARAHKFINQLRDFGCQFALDDFGSGLSSFAYLKNLQVTTLKIDGMFVKDIDENPINEAMVRSINEIGHVMQMSTVAEFVENDRIRERLVEIGIDYGQGYGLGKPMPMSKLLTYFERKESQGDQKVVTG